MPAELSITLTRLEKEASSIIGSGRENAAAVAAELDRRLVPVEGQPNPDFLAMQLGLVRLVETELVQVESLDESLVDELDGDRFQLSERILATEAVLDQLSAVQRACDGVYGSQAAAKLFGNVELLPRDPVRLAKLARRVHRRLLDAEYDLPEPRLKGWALSERAELAADLGTEVERLDGALGALTEERKGSDSQRFVKSGALDRFRATLRYAAECLSSLYGLAGYEELAAKIRPKRRRRRRTAGEGEPEASGPEPSGGEPSSPAGGDDEAPERPVGPTLVIS